ncbi:MAG: retron Ec67 family RNA-directed DNA polymerase/endonuclease, partial [Terriglobales bacterium]
MLANLKAAVSLSDVANLLSYRPKALAFILYKIPDAAKYNVFEVPKRAGGRRTIKAPVPRLKRLQTRVADLLQDCVDEVSDAQGRSDGAVHGFRRKHSIVTNARLHRRRRWVFNVDLEDFFPSINFGRVRGFLIKNRDFQLNEGVATVLAQIACHDNSLPQGSPCSPVISNLVAHALDMHLVRLARRAGCTYSRYADDLTFSTNGVAFPREIATPAGTPGAVQDWRAGRELRRAIERAGFKINPSKTRLMYRWSRQEVTGLVVNKKIGVRREYSHRLRAMVRTLTKTGGFTVQRTVSAGGAAATEAGTPQELHGMLGFVDSVDVYNAKHACAAPPGDPSSRERVYREFLFYSMFYAAPRPVVLCEGETDSVYLTHAIRSLASDFPELAHLDANKRWRIRAQLYGYPKSSTARLLGLEEGGSGALAKFIASYEKEFRRFSGPGPVHPVVMVYDNDGGAGCIRVSIRKISGAKPSQTDPFVRVLKNLYAVPTPPGPN